MPKPPLIPDLAEQAPPGPLLLAFSGGLDSSLLLHLLVDAGLGPRLRVVHINHQLQTNSADWAAHCEQIVAGLGLPCRVVTVTVDKDKGIEAGARQARYQALFADASRDGASVITAHHRDDQAETLLLRLLRGAGVQGLAAMRNLDHRQQIAVWRPLLELPRSELERSARERGLQWQEDPSNQDQSLRRNYLRHSILPALRQRWRGADEILARTARHMGDASELLDERAEEDAQACGVSAQRFPLAGLAALRPARQRNLLRWWLNRQGASSPSAAGLVERAGPSSAHAIRAPEMVTRRLLPNLSDNGPDACMPRIAPAARRRSSDPSVAWVMSVRRSIVGMCTTQMAKRKPLIPKTPKSAPRARRKPRVGCAGV